MQNKSDFQKKKRTTLYTLEIRGSDGLNKTSSNLFVLSLGHVYRYVQSEHNQF